MAVNWFGPERMAEIKAKVRRNMSTVCATMDTDIKDSMRNTAIDLDRRYTRGSKGYHFASVPGHPPAVDTSALIGSIKHTITEEENAIIGTVGSWGIDYAAPLEFGTATMAPRPWLMPAFERIKGRVTEMLCHD